jgi:DNA-directed RNA polymerase sigma subunit (sigma70/sigma32)
MKGFIEIHQDGEPSIINVNHICWVQIAHPTNTAVINIASLEQYSDVGLDSISLPTDETYDEIKAKIENAQTVYDIDKLMGLLPPREKQIVKMKFGICGFPVYSDEIIGKEFNITRECIRQVTDKGLKRIAKYVLTRNIQEEAIK